MMHGVSVIICCHNSAARLAATLGYLRCQEVSPSIPWEIILVDNASTDGTADVALNNWPNESAATLRVVNEPQLGLSHARNRGFSEAKYEIVSFIDDDNWVCPNWIQLVSEIMSAHSNIGACGGYNNAVCEIDPPWWFDLFKSSYAVGSQGESAGDITSTRGRVWGAGLNIRKVAWEHLLTRGFRPLLADRTGDAQTSGGDTELCFALRLAGWKLWYDPRLQLRHFLPAGRLEWQNLRRLHRGFGAASVWLDLYVAALEGPPKSLVKRLKRARPWKILAVVTRLFWHDVKLLRAFNDSSEGNPDILQVELRIGRLLELVQGRKKYAITFSDSGAERISTMKVGVRQALGE